MSYLILYRLSMIKSRFAKLIVVINSMKFYFATFYLDVDQQILKQRLKSCCQFFFYYFEEIVFLRILGTTSLILKIIYVETILIIVKLTMEQRTEVEEGDSS